MGRGADLARAVREIQRALGEFVNQDEREMIHVFETLPGHLRAVVGSTKFRGVGVTERQKLVWGYLKQSTRPDDLGFLWSVYPLDPDEYYEEHSPESSSSSAYPASDLDEP